MGEFLGFIIVVAIIIFGGISIFSEVREKGILYVAAGTVAMIFLALFD